MKKFNNLIKIKIQNLIVPYCFSRNLRFSSNYKRYKVIKILVKILHLTLNYDPEEKYSLNLENLEELNLGYSEYYHFEDKDLINLPNLRTLWLFGVKDFITGSCFIKLQNLQNLFLFEYDECYLEEENLQYLTNLKTFDCGVKISAYYLRNLTKLKKLTFTPNNEFKEEYLKDLISLKLLKFEVDYNEEEKIEINFTGKYLNNLENLTELIIPHSKVEDKYLIELTKLKALDVSCCKTITGECLLNLNNLQKLNINNTNIHERYLQNLKNLKYLNIDNCDNIIIGKFLLQMNRLNHFYRVRWFNITQINEIKLNIKKEMTLMNAIRNLENINFVNKQDKSIDEIQEIYNQLLEKEKENKLLKEVIQERENLLKEKDNVIEEKDKIIKQLIKEKEELTKDQKNENY